MKKKTRKSRTVLAPFQDGQIWQMGDSSLHIGLVGKTLVHYKHYKAQAKRPPVLLSGKDALEKFLQKERAILVHDTARLVPGAGRQGSAAGNVAGRAK